MRRGVHEPPPEADDAPADPDRVARTILLRQLSAAPRTRGQLARTLDGRGVPDEVADRVLDRFEEVGLIDDRAFARMWVESRQASRGLAPRALRRELTSKGVPDDIVAEALSTIGRESELGAARAVAARKARSVSGLPRPTQMRRLSSALARKGYGPGLVAQVVRETLDAMSESGVDAPSDECW